MEHSAELEEHLSRNLLDGRPTHIGELFRELVRLLDPEGVPYALVGPLALGLYIPRFRFTDEIRIVGAPGLEGQFGEWLATISRDEQYRQLRIHFDCAGGLANEHTIQNRVLTRLFGTVAPFASALSLAWMFLEGDQPQDLTDAGQLLHDGTVSAHALRDLLESHKAQHALDRLAEVQSSIERGGYSGSYNEYVKARLARLKR